MTSSQNPASAAHPSLRLWPGVAILVGQWLGWLVVPLVVSDSIASVIAVVGGLVGGVAILVWWSFFSRASGVERAAVVGLAVVGLAVTPRFLHESIAEGNMGFQFFRYVFPFLSLAVVGWAVATRRLSPGSRWATMTVVILLACGGWTLVRSNGVTGDGSAELRWRWTATAEEKLLANGLDESASVSSSSDSERSDSE